MGGTTLIKTVNKKDLGVTMKYIKISGQCSIAACNGNQVLGMHSAFSFAIHSRPYTSCINVKLLLWHINQSCVFLLHGILISILMLMVLN